MDFTTVPTGFGMALAQNETAMNAYAVMTKEQKQAVLARAHSVRSQEEMRQLVDSLAAEA